MAGSNDVFNSPIWSLVPKHETEVLKFLQTYPEYDGRDIVIAILDSGVDPAVEGLQMTSTGKTKVIERYDCSGAGDVDTSTIVKPVNGIIQGLSGRSLKIPTDWINPTQEYHIGIKNTYQLYPEKLKERIISENKEKLWDPFHKAAVAEATRKLQEFNEAHQNVPIVGMLKLTKEDLEAKIEILTNYEKKFNDVGPCFDCIVFHDGETWWACIDSEQTGDLADVELLGEYSKTLTHRYLTQQDQFTISINVHCNGNLLEIVGGCSPHGTHVAAIAAGYFPDSLEMNGVAPGAQIISLGIGDCRLGTMETGTSIVRACAYLMKLSKIYPVKIVNMSYGEHANWSNSGRTFDLINEVVNKYGIVWVASAGNHGPALCTVGSPPDISQATVIGVGAYVSPEMMVAEYSLRQKLPEMPFTWSSCGPTLDGHNGVSICAPGAAITSVSKWTQRYVQLMNGTSMSSPHVAGAVGLLISGLQKLNIYYSPYFIKRSLENTARVLEETERCAQGYGLVQIEKAFKYLLNHSECPCRDIRLDVTVNNTDKGILYRVDSPAKSKEFQILVNPFFLDKPSIKADLKTNFNIRLKLSCDTEYENLIQYPSFLTVANFSKGISIRVDPTDLPPGKAYFTTLNGYDVNENGKKPGKGPLLRIPITIIKPIELQDPVYYPKVLYGDVKFVPNTIWRRFFIVPEYATWASLQLNVNDKVKSERFFIHTMQIQPKLSCKARESQKFCTIGALTDNSHAFAVNGGLILEVTIAKYWASIGDVNLGISLKFDGVKPPSCPVITMFGGDGIQSYLLRTLHNDEISPSVTLKNSLQALRPGESELTALKERDVIPPERQIYQLILTYNFTVTKQTEVSPNCATFSDLLYENEFESQIWFIFDNNKQLMAVGDTDPTRYTVKLEKGDYVLKLQLRHEKKDLLEMYQDMPINISQKLPSSISLDVYGSKAQALVHGKKISSTTCPPDQQFPIYVSALSTEKSLKLSNHCQYLTGTITFVKDEQGKKVDYYPFRYVLPEPPKKLTNKSSPDKDKIKYNEYMDALRDLRVNWLVKLEGSDEVTDLYQTMIDEHKNHCTVHTAMLQSIDPLDIKKIPTLPIKQELLDEELSSAERVLDVCANVLEVGNGKIDQDKLLAYYGMKSDTRPDAAKIKTEMDRQKSAVVEALSRRGIIECQEYINLKEFSVESEMNEEELLNSIKETWNDIVKFADPNDTKVIIFSMWHSVALSQYGRLLKYLQKYAEEKPSKELDSKVESVLGALQWKHCASYVKRAIPTRYPASYASF